MKKLKFLLSIILFINVSACGYSRLSVQSNELKFNNIEINGDKRLSYILKNNLELLSKPESNKSFDLLLNLTSSKTSKIKDTTGKTKKIIEVDKDIDENNVLKECLKDKKISEQINEKKIIRTVFVKNKIINYLIK